MTLQSFAKIFHQIPSSLSLQGAVQVLTYLSTIFLSHLQTFSAKVSFFPSPADSAPSRTFISMSLL